MALIIPFREFYPVVDAAAFLAPTATIIGRVKLGKSTSVWFGAILRGDVEPISVGERTNIQDLVVVHVTSGGGTARIGDGVTIGHRAVIHGCRVHEDCLIGIGAVVLDGAEVGPGSIVAAGSVVPPGMRVPPGVMVRGVPAKLGRMLTEADLSSIRASSANYVTLSEDYGRR